MGATMPTYECQDCIGMKEHGCYCASQGCPAPGVPPADPADERRRFITCPSCGGEGSWEIPTGRYNHLDGSLITEGFTCKTCRGDGVVEDEPKEAFDDADDLYGGGCGGVEDREDPNDY